MTTELKVRQNWSKLPNMTPLVWHAPKVHAYIARELYPLYIFHLPPPPLTQNPGYSHVLDWRFIGSLCKLTDVHGQKICSVLLAIMYLADYCRLCLFSACAYKPHLWGTMCLTGSVRLIKSGIALASPSKLKRVMCMCQQTCDSELNAKKKSREDDKRPSIRGVYFFTNKHVQTCLKCQGAQSLRYLFSSTSLTQVHLIKCLISLIWGCTVCFYKGVVTLEFSYKTSVNFWKLLNDLCIR